MSQKTVLNAQVEKKNADNQLLSLFKIKKIILITLKKRSRKFKGTVVR